MKDKKPKSKKHKSKSKSGQRLQYLKEYMPEHPRADIFGMVAVHILEAEKLLGRSLADGEIVHHRDFDKLNNRGDNYSVITRAEHQMIPEMQATYLVESGLMYDFWTWWAANKERVELTKRAQLLHQRLTLMKEKHARDESKRALQPGVEGSITDV